MKGLYTYIIAVISLISANTLTAQEYHHAVHEDPRYQFQMGLKLGVNVSNVYDEQGNQIMPDPKFGFAGGGYLSIPFSRYFGLQPEALYSQKGFLSRGTVLNMDYSYTLSTNYVDLPLHFQFKPWPAITILLGPQYSMLLSSNDQFGYGTLTVTEQNEIRKNNIRKDNFGISAGIDARLNHLVLSLRNCWDLQSNNGEGSSLSPDYKNVWLQGTIGYEF